MSETQNLESKLFPAQLQCCTEFLTSVTCEKFEFTTQLKSISWGLAEFYYNTCLQRSYSCTCTILQETINMFLCALLLFVKSETSIKFEGRD